MRLIGEANFEVQSSYSVVVRAVDPQGLYAEVPFEIVITDVAESPTALSLSNTRIDENVSVGTLVGTFATTDPDLGETFSYSILSIDGDASDTSFAIVGNELRTNARMNFEARSGYVLRVQTTDSDGLQFDRLIRVDLTDLVELPPQASNDAGAPRLGWR